MCAVSEMLLEKLQSKKYERGPMLSTLKELNVFSKKKKKKKIEPCLSA